MIFSLQNPISSAVLRFFARFLAHFAIISLVFDSTVALANSLPITVDGSTNTQVTQTASGVDQINIAAPNSSGLSHNKFNDYNVNTAGQIINNFSGQNPSEISAGTGTTAVTQTQIGGLVTVNSNLSSSGSAKIILNEVTSNNTSQLLGYTEIAGTKADLILANPNGIACSGCGFINTARLLMIAGNSNFDSNGNLGFNLKEQANPNLYVPLITVDGLGLDVSTTSSADIVASSVKLLSTIYGSDSNSITLQTGEGRYDYTNKSITPSSSSLTPTSAVFAIDASSLAKIQAGNIYLIATKLGVGVKMENEILASSTVNIDANGDVYYENISAGDTLNITSTQKLSSSDSSKISAPNITITANQFDNLGTAIANNFNIQNVTTLNNYNEIQALDLNLNNITNFNNSGTIYGQDFLSISGANLINNSDATIYSPVDYTITLTGLLTNSGLITSVNNLNVNSNQLINNSEISAQNNLTLTITDYATNSGNLIANKNLNLTANSLTNSGATQSGGTSIFNLSTLNNSENSSIYSDDTLNLNLSSSLTNLGSISSQSDLTITGSSSITNSNKILSNGILTINATNLTNNLNAAIASLANVLTLTISNQFTNSGNLQSIGNTTLTAASLDNSGTIKSFGTATINTNSITNQANAVIFASSDLGITASNYFINSGSILSGSNLEITSGTTTNNSEIYAVGNLTLNLSDTFTNNNAASLKSLGSLTIDSSNSIINFNQIASNSNLTITATTLTNSKTIQSNGNLTLNLSNSLTNNSSISSAGSFTINAASFTNSANSLILASGDLTINATSVTNQNTKPSASTITSGIISSGGAITIKSDSFNNNSGIVAGKSTTLNALTASSVTLNNTNGIFLATAAILLNLGNLDYNITGTVTASTIDITANNITNTGNVTANDYIKLNATGNSGVSGSGNITNGSATGDNSNTKLVAGTYVNFTAKNNINNYATIQGSTDTTLTATNGSINNYSTGKITGGSGTTTINALNNAFNNLSATSLLTSNNNAIFNVKDLNNNGAIDVANNLTTNVSNNLNNNSTALIWSGNDMTLNVANILTNTSADIYATNNLTIQKNSAGDKTTSVQNVSGEIATYNGDIVINAATFSNIRALSPVQEGKILSMPNARNSTNMDYWKKYAQNCSGNNCENWSYYYAGWSYPKDNSTSAKLSSGKNLTLNLSSFYNESSDVTSVGNMNINFQNSFNNYSIKSLIGNFVYVFIAAWDRDYHVLYNANTGAIIKGGDDTVIPSNYLVVFPAYIKAGSSLTIAQNGVNKNSTFVNSTNVLQNTSVSKVDQQTATTTINKIDIYTLGQTGALTVDLSAITTAIGNNRSATSGSSQSVSDVSGTPDNIQSSGLSATTTSDIVYLGLFKINLDPAATTPLVESRSQFTDASKFFGSSYYFNALGLNGAEVLANLDRQTRTTNIRMLGDSFVETKLILDQLKTLTNDSLLLSKTTTDTNAQIKELLDNSVSEFAELGLSAQDVAQNGLTTDQVNSLTKDIVTFELTNVNGIEVLAPKIYLSIDTRNRLLGSDSALASNSTISAMSDLTINAPTTNLTNSGTISAGNDLTINIGSLNSSSLNFGTQGSTAISSLSQIKAGNNLTITATSSQTPSISLNNTYLSSGGATSLSSTGDITIANDKNLKFTTLSASIPSLNIPSTSRLFFAASAIKDEAADARSALTFNSGSDIDITSSGNINIANNYTNTGGSIFMTAANNINNSNFTVYASNNVVMEANNINNIATANNSNETKIEAGNIVSLNATKDSEGNGGNITNIGATISAGNLVYLTADNNITNKALVQYNINGTNSYSSGLSDNQTAANFTNTTLDSAGTSTSDTNMLNSGADHINSTLLSQGNITSGGNLVLVAGNNLNNIGSNITSTGSTYIEATNGDINITTIALRDRTVLRWGHKSNGGTSTEDKTTNLQSSITSNGDLDILSGNDITLQAAKLIAGEDTVSTSSNGDINLTAGNNLLLTTATDSYFKHVKTSKKGTFAFKNNDRGSIGTTVINNEISQAGDLNFNVGNINYAEYKTGSMESSNPKLAYLKQLDPSTAIYNPVNEMSKAWDTTTRGLTQTSQILIAVAMSAIIVATGGAAAAGAAAATSAGATAGGVAATAAAAGAAATVSTAATTATLSATNASMNDSGNFFRSLDDVGKITLKETTSKDSFQNMAIAGLTAALTAGVVKASGLTPISSTTTVNAPTITTTVTNTVATVGIGTVANTLVTSVVKGQSLGKSIEEQGGATDILTNTAVMALAQLGAQEIGRAYHGETTTLKDSSGNPLTNIDGTTMTTGTISQPTQLTLHAALGCAASSAMGGSCGAGAAGAMAGELTAEYAYNNLHLDKNTSIALASVTSAGAALLTSSLQGNDDEYTAKNVQLGSILGSNAAENNAISAQAHQVQIGDNLKSDFYHFSWLIVPDDQNMWRDNPSFKSNKTTDGKVYATIGGGPDNPIKDIITEFGLPNLHGGINREPYDIDFKIKTFTTQIDPSVVGNENIKIQQLLDMNQKFESNPNKLNYWFFPEKNNNFYNSNSYFTGIGKAVGLPIPAINIKAPGYDKPVPLKYFTNPN